MACIRRISFPVLWHAAWVTKSGPVFTISEVGPSASGQYYCEARNRIGAHSSPVLTVRVRGTNTFTFVTCLSTGCYQAVFLLVYKNMAVIFNHSATLKKDMLFGLPATLAETEISEQRWNYVGTWIFLKRIQTLINYQHLQTIKIYIYKDVHGLKPQV